MPIVITLSNQKGGVGKTTTTVNLADAVSRLGYHVLVVDADPQGNSTSIFLEDINLRDQYSLVAALELPVEEATLTAMACRTTNQRLDVVPNSIRCMLWERAAANTPDAILGMLRLFRHDRGLKKYDFVFIDTPPNIGTMVNNALMVSDYVVVPIPPSDQFALDGLATLLRIIQNIRSQNDRLKLMGVVMTKLDHRSPIYTKNQKRIAHFLTRNKLHVFNTTIPLSVNVDMSHMKRQTIFEFAPDKNAALTHMRLAKEVVQLVERIHGQKAG